MPHVLKNESNCVAMIIPLVKRAPILESLRERATDGISTWLFRLIDRMPGIIPTRADPTVEDPAAAVQLHRFVRDTVTINPMSRSPLSPVQTHLIEFALECVDWSGLARDPRLWHLDWSQARLVHPCDPATHLPRPT